MVKATCSVEGCDKSVKARNWCAMHYKRWKTHGDPLIKLYGKPKRTCSIDGCDGIACARGWCSKHHQRWRNHGDPLIVTREEPGQYANTICRADGCEKEVGALGLCDMHYARWRKHGSLELSPRQRPPRKRCTISKCRNLIECRDMCDMHYQRWRKHGDPHIRAVLLPVPPCAVDGCGNRTAKCGVCWKHYRYFRAKFAAEQGNRCKICGIHESESSGKKLKLDHNHSGAKLPRALLCHHCNVGLGLFRDDPKLLAAAIRYLDDTQLGQLPLFAA